MSFHHLIKIKHQFDKNSNTFQDLTITTKDDLNYTLSSDDESLINSIQKHQSDILAHNNELFSQVKTR